MSVHLLFVYSGLPLSNSARSRCRARSSSVRRNVCDNSPEISPSLSNSKQCSISSALFACKVMQNSKCLDIYHTGGMQCPASYTLFSHLSTSHVRDVKLWLGVSALLSSLLPIVDFILNLNWKSFQEQRTFFFNVCLLKRFVQNYDAQVLTDKNISLVASKPMAHASPSASQEQIRYIRFTSPATAIDTTICRILSDLICANVAVHGLITESIQQAWLPPSPGRHSSLLTGLDEVGRFVLVIVIQNFLGLFKQFCRHFTYSFFIAR